MSFCFVSSLYHAVALLTDALSPKYSNYIDNDHPYLVLHLKRSVFSISLLKIIFVVVFSFLSRMPMIRLWTFPYIPSLRRFLFKKNYLNRC